MLLGYNDDVGGNIYQGMDVRAMTKRSQLHTIVSEAVGIYGSSPTCHLSALTRIRGYTFNELNHALGVKRS
ncbi:MAG: hypothetical protein AMS22_15715 [Thiotrichales bacterium SG8_50]|nr:MAG: hypothetical protein AMS22_15715 [Thiotrichales bacterium SG8_50]